MLRKENKKTKILCLCVIVMLMIVGALFQMVNVNRSVALQVDLSTLAYNTDEFLYLSDLHYEPESSAGWGSITLDRNSDGDLISVMKDGKRTYFLKGIFAHANSTVIYDLSKYSYDYFTTYIGIDGSRGTAGNVKFKIFTSTNKEDWQQVESTDAFLGDTEAKFVKIPLQGVKYLKLEANTNGVATSDHSVYANAKLIKEGYEEKFTTADFIKDINEYDNQLKGYSAEEILARDDLTLALLQRNFVKNIGYELLQVYATGDEETEKTLEWLFQNKEILKMYTTGGKPLGNYISSLQVLSRLYNTYQEDLSNPLYQKLMIAISLTHSNPVCFWVSGKNNERVCSDPIKRYRVIKELYETQKLETEVFESLNVEEMRWVVDNQLSDEEIPWLNWFSTQTKNGETVYANRDGYLNPYTYIAYDYAHVWNYYDEGYYVTNSLCATDNKNKLFDGYSRTMSCNEKYHLDDFSVNSHSSSIPRLWVVFEEDGVCGALSKTGANLLASYGYPTAVIGQPGHAAYLSPQKQKDPVTNKYITTWNLGNPAAGWAQSEKGERFPLNWGSKANGWHSYYNVSYIVLIQDAFNDFSNYEDALLLMLTKDLKPEDVQAQENIYRAALQKESFNLDAYKGLIDTYHANDKKTSHDYFELAKEIIQNMKKYPLAMNDLLKLIESDISDQDKIQYSNLAKEALNEVIEEAKTNKASFHPNYGAIKDMAEYILGNTQSLKVATFSFDGENANSIVLQGSFAENKTPFRFSVDGEKTWREVVDGSVIVPLTQEELAKLNDTEDIYVHIIGSTFDEKNKHVIDILTASTPTNLYANDLENKVMGNTANMEWSANHIDWYRFSDGTPVFKGNETIYVRYHKYANYLPGKEVTLEFTQDEEDEKTRYISIDRLSIYARSTEHGGEEATKIIDGNKYTMWHSHYTASEDKEKYVTIAIADGAYLSKIEYLPRISSENGIIKDVTILGSVDGETWIPLVEHTNWDYNHQLKSVELEESTYVKLVKFQVNESKGGWVSGSMINLFEDATKELPKEEEKTPEDPPVEDQTNKEETKPEQTPSTEEKVPEPPQEETPINSSNNNNSSSNNNNNNNNNNVESTPTSNETQSNENLVTEETEIVSPTTEEPKKEEEKKTESTKKQDSSSKESTQKEKKEIVESSETNQKDEIPLWVFIATPMVILPIGYGIVVYFKKY